MKLNIGSADRWIRIIVGIVLILLGIFKFEGTGKWVAIIVGLIPLITALIGWCPLYTLLGISTKKGEGEQ